VLGRSEQDILVECGCAARVAVHPDRAAVDDVPDILVACSLEHDRSATCIDEIRTQRLERDLVDIGDGREMDHSVARPHGLAKGWPIQDVTGDAFDPSRTIPLRLHQVEDERLVPSRQQAVDDVRADEAGPAGDEDPHVSAPFMASW
jgi:hypothetical protein